ncbi:MAG TPA: ComEC/Rec2 family competence protein [Verrucomicrobiota bacterium]|nr:hypothetical protein [Verrucomicrobiales bacterium]HRI16028.1 ComEC/Rec2 family competence protein [Verrucomicrobiota bacterium]
MKRPWLLPAVGFAGGIVIAEWLASGWEWTFPALATGTFALARRHGRDLIALVAGWAAAGWLAWWSEQTPLSEWDLRLEQTQPALVEVRGKVSEMPVLRLNQFRGRTTVRTTVAVSLEAWRIDGHSWRPIRGQVITSTHGSAPAQVFSGQRVEIVGLLQAVPGPKAPGLFDYPAQLRFQGITHLLEAESFQDWRTLDDPPIPRPWSASFLPWAQRALAAGLPDDQSTRLLWAMTLGWRTALTPAVSSAFVESGTMHVFAISGLHIALMSGVWVAVLRLVRVQREWCGLLVVPGMWLYVAATGWQPSAVRSAVMMSIVVCGWALRRPGDVLNSLSLAALVILVIDPGELFQAGFQLSFAAVAGLTLWAPLFGSWGERLLTFPADPMLPETLRPWWHDSFNDGLHALVNSMAISAAALVATLPLTIHYFHLLSPISLLANVVVVPLSSLALAANVAALATYLWCPSVAEFFNAGAWLWMEAMTGLSRWFARVPGGVWAVANPAPGWWAAYYAFLLAPAWGAIVTVSRRRIWLMAGASLTAVAAGWFLWTQTWTSLAILPGEALVVDAPGRGNDLVVNSGGVVNAERAVLPWLRAHGWNRIPRLVIAQADAAHAGGATNILKRIATSEIVVGPRNQRSPIFRGLLKDAEQRGIEIVQVHRADAIGSWEVLGPEPRSKLGSAAEEALILEGAVAGTRILILPRVTPAILRQLQDTRPTRGLIDVVVTAVSPSREVELNRLLEHIGPQLVIVTDENSWDRSRANRRPRKQKSPTSWRMLEIAEVGGVELRIRKGAISAQAANGTNWELGGRGIVMP